MTQHFYTSTSPNAATRPPTIPQGIVAIPMPLDLPMGSRVVGTNTWAVLDRHGLRPTPLAVDLYRLAVLAYAVDTRIPRKHSPDRWTRDLALHVPVADPAVWSNAVPIIQDLLAFLTGDRWALFVYSKRPTRPKRRRRRKFSVTAATTVALFSGGLDSLIGALDQQQKREPTLYVGHYESPSTKRVQTALHEELGRRFGQPLSLLQLMVLPALDLTGEREPTTRSRSFLFFSLAALAASALRLGERIIVPENGLIALNVPLTRTRLGPLSTRTAHPHTLHLYQRMLEALGMRLTISNPYAFLTKGEMTNRAREAGLDQGLAKHTMSCAHPTSGRWRRGSPFQHCGKCVPCIIRRASLRVVGWDDAADYCWDILGPAQRALLRDRRAFELGVARAARRIDVTDLLRSGPMTDDPGSLRNHIEVYRRGMAEVGSFLSSG